MKKIGIVTIVDDDNYGNRLQNYALQEVIKKLGFEPVTLKNNKRFNNKVKKSKLVLNLLGYIKKNVGVLVKGNAKRIKNFKKFNEKINFSNKMITAYTKNLNDEYFKFIVGSDQVWKPIYGRMSYVDLLCFAESNKKIAYAPSFGISEIDDKYKSFLKKGLEDYKYISVREEQGAKIIKDVANKNAEVLLDPTLLLTKEEWEKIQVKPEKLSNKKYILTYFLGNNSKLEQIKELANRENLDVINIMDKSDVFYEAGPSEFLYLFNNAEVIFTDSFHACVFSMIFEKPFFVLDREQKGMNNMNSRLDTLLTKFAQVDRKITDIAKIDNIYSCNYNEFIKILNEEKNKSFDFLKKALEIE